MSPVKRKSIYFGVKRSRSRVTNQCRRGSVHSCECWLILVRHWHDVARSFFDGMNVIKLFAALFTESLSVWESVVSRRLSRVCPLGEIHLRQTRTAAVDPGIVVGRPQSCEPFVAQTTARVEPVQRSQQTNGCQWHVHNVCMLLRVDHKALTQDRTDHLAQTTRLTPVAVRK